MNRRDFLSGSIALLGLPTIGLAHIERLRPLKLFSCLNMVHRQVHHVVAFDLNDAKKLLADFYTCPDHPKDEWTEYEPDSHVCIKFPIDSPNGLNVVLPFEQLARDWCVKRGVIHTKECSLDFHLFDNGTELVVALSPEDAEEFYFKETGVTKEEYEDKAWTQVPDDRKITILDFDNFDGEKHPKVTKTAQEWCLETRRRCVIASTEY